MTVRDVLKEVTGDIKGIYLRSIRDGEIYKVYHNASEIDEGTLSQDTPGYVENFGRVTVDMY